MKNPLHRNISNRMKNPLHRNISNRMKNPLHRQCVTDHIRQTLCDVEMLPMMLQDGLTRSYSMSTSYIRTMSLDQGRVLTLTAPVEQRGKKLSLFVTESPSSSAYNSGHCNPQLDECHKACRQVQGAGRPPQLGVEV